MEEEGKEGERREEGKKRENDSEGFEQHFFSLAVLSPAVPTFPSHRVISSNRTSSASGWREKEGEKPRRCMARNNGARGTTDRGWSEWTVGRTVRYYCFCEDW